MSLKFKQHEPGMYLILCDGVGQGAITEYKRQTWVVSISKTSKIHKYVHRFREPYRILSDARFAVEDAFSSIDTYERVCKDYDSREENNGTANA